MVAANDGNITVQVEEDTVLIILTGVSKGELTPDMLLRIDLDGNTPESAEGYSPTSETAMHLMVYKHNKDAMPTYRAHCVYLSTSACVGIELDMATAPEPTLITGKTPVAPYACPGTSDLAQSVVPFLNDHKAILLANYGPISWGTSPKDAWCHLESTEAFAKLSLIPKYIIKDFRPLSNEQPDILEKVSHLISALNKVRTGRETVNLEKGKSLQNTEADSVTLSDDCIEKLVDMVVERMTSISQWGGDPVDDLKRQVHIVADIGASTGRLIVGWINDGQLCTGKIHRLVIEDVSMIQDRMRDVHRYYEEIIQGVKQHTKQNQVQIIGIGVSAFGSDFGLIGKDGNLLSLPRSYRGLTSDGDIFQLADGRMKPWEIHQYNGNQCMLGDTLHQLACLKEKDDCRLRDGCQILFVADIFHYLLCGNGGAEHSLSSHSKL